MAVYLSPVGGVAAQFFDNNGVPLVGGKLYTYQAGTTTPQATYTTNSGAVARTNPIILDAGGRVPNGGEIWVSSQSYKFVLFDANDVLIASWDNIAAGGTASYTPQNFTGDGTTLNFTLTSAPNNEDSTFVYINGIYQDKNTYGVSGTTLAFSEAPPTTSVIEVLYV